jgi:hypothetical protein
MTGKKQKVVDVVIEQIKKDLFVGDETCLEELLSFIPKKTLINSLPEEDWEKFKTKK